MLQNSCASPTQSNVNLGEGSNIYLPFLFDASRSVLSNAPSKLWVLPSGASLGSLLLKMTEIRYRYNSIYSRLECVAKLENLLMKRKKTRYRYWAICNGQMHILFMCILCYLVMSGGLLIIQQWFPLGLFCDQATST